MVSYLFSTNTGFGNDYYYMAHVKQLYPKKRGLTISKERQGISRICTLKVRGWIINVTF